MSGAPFRYTSANTTRGHCLAGNGLFQRRFIPDDPHDPVVDLDPVNDGLDIGLAAGVVAVSLVRHGPHRRIGLPGLDADGRQASLRQTIVQPRRQRTGLQADALDRQAEPSQRRDERRRFAFGSSFLDDAARSCCEDMFKQMNISGGL